LNALPAYKNIDNRQLKGLTYDYSYYNYPKGELDKTRIYNHKTSPAATVGPTITSSGVNWGVGGEIGIDGPRVSGGVNVQSSFSYETPDLTTENISGLYLNDVNFRFIIAFPENCVTCFPRITGLAKATFKPITAWIWRVSPDVAKENPLGLIVDQYFHARLYDYNYYKWPYAEWYVENFREFKVVDPFAVTWPLINK
jgi:hypothetical protein